MREALLYLLVVVVYDNVLICVFTRLPFIGIWRNQVLVCGMPVILRCREAIPLQRLIHRGVKLVCDDSSGHAQIWREHILPLHAPNPKE